LGCIKVASWSTDLALASFFTEETSIWASLTGTSLIGVKAWVTGLTLVDVFVTNGVDFGRLTVVDIDINISITSLVS